MGEGIIVVALNDKVYVIEEGHGNSKKKALEMAVQKHNQIYEEEKKSVLDSTYAEELKKEMLEGLEYSYDIGKIIIYDNLVKISNPQKEGEED